MKKENGKEGMKKENGKEGMKKENGDKGEESIKKGIDPEKW